MSIKVENISKKYENGVEVLKNIHLEAEKGEFIVLVGPSGCGKSTLLKIIAGLEKSDSGKIFINDIDITEKKPSERGIGMVFQNYALYPHLSVFENLSFPLKIKKENRYSINDKVKNIAKILELEHLLERKPKELSGGQRQRVALGRALIKSPQLFLFDEPLSNLDAKLRNQTRDEIVNIHKRIGISSVYVTHDQIEAMTMADKIAVINEGKILQFDTPYNIYNMPINVFVAEFIGSPKINLIECIAENGVIKTNDGIELTTRNIKNGEYILAVRPEDLRVSESGGIKNILTKKEFYGDEWIFFCNFGEHKIKFKSKNNVIVEDNQVNLTIEKFLLYERSGELIT